MGVRLSTLGLSGIAALVAWTTLTGTAQAQPRRFNPEQLPLSQPNYIEAFQRIDGEANFWDDVAAAEGMMGDAKFMFGMPTYKDNDLFWVGKRVNALYRDILIHQAGGNIIRTQDLQSPYCESMMDVPVCQVAVQAPPPAPMYYPPVYQPPMQPVPARY